MTARSAASPATTTRLAIPAVLRPSRAPNVGHVVGCGGDDLLARVVETTAEDVRDFARLVAQATRS